MCELCNINPFIIYDALADEHDNIKLSVDEMDDNDNTDNEQDHPVSGGVL